MWEAAVLPGGANASFPTFLTSVCKWHVLVKYRIPEGFHSSLQSEIDKAGQLVVRLEIMSRCRTKGF